MANPRLTPIFDSATAKLIGENNRLKQENGELSSRCEYYMERETQYYETIKQLRKQLKNLKAQNATLEQHLNPKEAG